MFFNGDGPIVGPSAIQAAVVARHQKFASISHDIRNVLLVGDGSAAILETAVTYSLLDGGKAVLRGCSILEFKDGALTNWRIYVDPSPLAGGSPTQ
jgi:hypothetical protein